MQDSPSTHLQKHKYKHFVDKGAAVIVLVTRLLCNMLLVFWPHIDLISCVCVHAHAIPACVLAPVGIYVILDTR